MEAGLEQKYSFDVVRWFTIMAVVYLVVGASVGVYIASELAWPFLNFDSPYPFGVCVRFIPTPLSSPGGGRTTMPTASRTVQRTWPGARLERETARSCSGLRSSCLR